MKKLISLIAMVLMLGGSILGVSAENNMASQDTRLADTDFIAKFMQTRPQMAYWFEYQYATTGAFPEEYLPHYINAVNVEFVGDYVPQPIDFAEFGRVYITEGFFVSDANPTVHYDVNGKGYLEKDYDYQIYFEDFDNALAFINSDFANIESKEFVMAGFPTSVQEKEPIYGDLNFDGKFGISDLIAITRKISKNSDFTELEKYLADFNKDGKINAVDLIIAKRKFLAQFE